MLKLMWRSLDFYEGDLLIDGRSIKQFDLKALRSQIMVVTQETALLEGTLRENICLNLTGLVQDDRIVGLLRRLEFSHTDFERQGLDMHIQTDGSNLSAGEKQLISFARTLLIKKKIVILDEATASIDLRTEEKIQSCVEEDFKGSTMIIIAHRLQTVMKCDRIVILEQGKIAAVDKPANLTSNPYFKQIVDLLV